jgi:hypothetical protein
MIRTVSLTALGALLAPGLALACGGLFCDGLLTIPVEQSGERILFEPDGPTGTVTTTVDIQYEGDPASFSWILPIPVSDAMPVPDLALAPEDLLRDLEGATVPRIVPPPTTCATAPPGVFGGGPNSGAGDDSDGAFGDDDDGGVDVTDLPNVGPFDNELIQSDDAGALIEWLNDNGYLVSPAMEPAIADYVGAGLAFLGVRLLPDTDSAEIAPLSVTWPGSEPMIPLRMTSIAAEPDMGLLVFIASDEPWESTNWTTSELDQERLQFDPFRNQTNYQALVSRQIDELGGQGFVREMVVDSSTLNAFGTTPESGAALRELFLRRSTITRLHGRAHPEEMVSDPVFGPGGNMFSGTFDLSERPAIEICGPSADSTPVPCGDTYCGVGGTCATTDSGIDGCVCEAGLIAREVRNPDRPGGSERAVVVCQSDALEFLGDFGPSEVDVCASTVCGSGSCVAVNGFPSCSCNEGFAAVATATGSPTCSAVVTLYPDGDQDWDGTLAGCGGCSMEQRSPTGLAALFVFLLGGALRSRRSRR